MSLRQQRSREANGKEAEEFFRERYWEQKFLAYVSKPRNHRMAVCVHRSGRVSRDHSFDKDGRCIFCDWLVPERDISEPRLIEKRDR